MNVMTLVLAFCIVMAPGVAFAQHRSGDSGSGGTAVAVGAPSGGGSSSGGSSSTSSGGGDSAQFSSSIGGGTSGTVGHRTGGIAPNPASANTNSGAFTNYSNLSPAPEFSRPRNGLPIEIAVPRGSVPSPKGNGVTFIIGAYNPWLYAYNGLYDMPFYGVFDPFAADFGFPIAPLWTTSSTPAIEKGVLNLDVKPHDAEVYVDGGLVGKANQFQGLFHKLRLEAGVHRVELRAPGYETLIVNVRILAGESMSYRGTLEKIAP